MSKVAIAGNASGTGTFTIAAPNSNTDRTLTLPDEAGTVLTSGGAIDVNASAPADSVVIDSSGNAGIGTSSPASRLEVRNTDGEMARFRTTSGSNQPVLNITASDSAGTVGFGTGGNASFPALTFSNGGSERMRIDSSGNLLVGNTSGSNRIHVTHNSSGTWAGFFSNTYTASGNTSLMAWARDGGAVAAGVRYKDATTSMEFYSPSGHTVAYTTSSDYRLKENIAPMTGALATVAQLKPCTYTWKEGFGTGQSQGFIAHELQAVVPDAVTGEKDAVETYTDEEGNEQTRPVYQGVDTSFLVATLTAAIQELKAELDAAKERIAALEAA